MLDSLRSLFYIQTKDENEALTSEHGHSLMQVARHSAKEIEQPAQSGLQTDLGKLREHKARNEQIEYLFVTEGTGTVIAFVLLGAVISFGIVYTTTIPLRAFRKNNIRNLSDSDQFITAVRELGLYWLVLNEPPPAH